MYKLSNIIMLYLFVFIKTNNYLAQTVTFDYSSGGKQIKKQVSVPVPDIQIVTSGNICPGNILILSASGADSYFWSNGLQQSSLGFQPNVGDTVFTVIGANSSGCIGYDTIALNILPYPVLSSINGPSNVNLNSEYTYSVPTEDGLSYIWTIENGVFETPPNAPFVSVIWYANPGSLTVTAQNINGCESEPVSIEIEVSTSIQEINNPRINIYPVPAKDGIYIDIQLPTANKLDYTITDFAGKVIWSSGISQSEQQQKLWLDRSLFDSPGVYLFTATSNNHTTSKKFIIQ